jgi:hypothetical protein
MRETMRDCGRDGTSEDGINKIVRERGVRQGMTEK